MANSSAVASGETAQLRDIAALLELGVQISKLEELYGQDVVRHAAKDFVKSQATHAGRLTVGAELLLRSKSTVRSVVGDDQFLEALLSSLEEDPEPMLMDPLMMIPLKDPVVLSSGFVVDRRTALDEEGHMRLHSCPFSRVQLHRQVYPLHILRDKVKAWKLDRLNRAVDIAETLVSEGHVAAAERVFDIAENFMDEVGDSTYTQVARRLAEVERRSPAAKEAARSLKIYRRLARILDEAERVDLVKSAVEEFMAGITAALAEGSLQEAASWTSSDICGWLASRDISAHWEVLRPQWFQLRLQLAKRQQDMQAVWEWRRTLRALYQNDAAKLGAFLTEEGLTGQESELQAYGNFDVSLWEICGLNGEDVENPWLDPRIGLVALGSEHGPTKVVTMRSSLGPISGQDWSCEVAFWVDGLSFQSYRNSVFSAHGHGTGWEVRVDAQQGIELVWTATSGGHNEYTCGLGHDCVHRWTHVVVAFVASTSSTTVYVNGQGTRPKRIQGTFICAGEARQPRLGMNPEWQDRYVWGQAAFARVEQRLLDGAVESHFAEHVQRLAASRLAELAHFPASFLPAI